MTSEIEGYIRSIAIMHAWIGSRGYHMHGLTCEVVKRYGLAYNEALAIVASVVPTLPRAERIGQ
jgi:hypothetical protein